MSGLGRSVPPDWRHVEEHPHRMDAVPAGQPVEVEMRLSDILRSFYNQGSTPQCVAFSQCIAESINKQNMERFNAPELFHAVHLLEGITDPNIGADVRDGFQVMASRGPWEIFPHSGLDAADGPASYSWCTSMDQVRAAMANREVVVFGINWYSGFDSPVKRNKEWWIGLGSNLGQVRGGHAICATKWSDRRQAFQFTNSWGLSYPRVWVPTAVGERLLKENGEAGYGIQR